MVKKLSGVNVCLFEDIGFEELVHTNIHRHTPSVTFWDEGLLCCSELMVNNRFVSTTVQHVNVCGYGLCERACLSVSFTSFSSSYYGHLKFCASF